VVLVLGVVGGVAGARAVQPLGGGDAAAEPTPATTGPPPTTAPAARDEAWPAHCDVPALAGPDVDGDGCPEEVTLDGRTATLGSVTVLLGEEGDLVALGDWDCDGIATPALLRPATGEVFVFPRWSIDEPLEVTATTVVPDASAVAAGSGDCPQLVVETPDGERTVAVEG
jgi:hypothetical protein